MEIINEIEAKVRSAIQKIEQLEMRILELEDEKKEGEEKLESILKALGPIELEDESDEDASEAEIESDEAEAETEYLEAEEGDSEEADSAEEVEEESDSDVSMHDSDNLYSEEQRHQQF
ncbi:MAG: hypothetical protein GY786_08410 [Proteobacteria bacterium]|nr:hypothetical protein [Pseudomonadota bacterium]